MLSVHYLHNIANSSTHLLLLLLLLLPHTHTHTRHATEVNFEVYGPVPNFNGLCSIYVCQTFDNCRPKIKRS